MSARRSVVAVLITAAGAGIVEVLRLPTLSLKVNEASLVLPGPSALPTLWLLILAGALIVGVVLGIPTVLLLRRFRLSQWHWWALAGYVVFGLVVTLPDLASRLPSDQTITMYTMGHAVVENRVVTKFGYFWVALAILVDATDGAVLGLVAWVLARGFGRSSGA